MPLFGSAASLFDWTVWFDSFVVVCCYFGNYLRLEFNWLTQNRCGSGIMRRISIKKLHCLYQMTRKDYTEFRCLIMHLSTIQTKVTA